MFLRFVSVVCISGMLYQWFSLLLMDSIPLYEYTPICVSHFLLMDIWAISRFELLGIKLL